MKCLFFKQQFYAITALLVLLSMSCGYSSNAEAPNNPDETELHFGFKTENGQYRTEDIKYNNTLPVDANGFGANGVTSYEQKHQQVKPVEYRGGYSFISADGYEYTVVYKAGKKGFQPYVTAHKVNTAK